MEQVDIRNYLYHGISNSNSRFGSLFILDSILKTGFLVNSKESRKYGVKSIYDTYIEMGYTPRISLGFYPLDQKTYELSKRRHPNYYGPNIIKRIMLEHRVNEENIDEYIMSCDNLNSNPAIAFDYAWKTFYRGITLLFDKQLLEDLKISDYGILADEICIDEPIDIKKYLKYIAVRKERCLKEVIYLINKYDFNIEVIDFDTGEKLVEKQNELKLANIMR